MNTQLREALLSELVSTNDYLCTLADNDKRKFHAQKRFNLLRALLAHFDEQDNMIEHLSKSNKILRSRYVHNDNITQLIVRNVDREYGTTKWSDFYRTCKDNDYGYNGTNQH